MSDASRARCYADAAHASAGRSVAHPRWTLTGCILATSLAFVDGSVVNVALPAIGRDLGGGAGELQWTINAYLLPLSALLLFGGALGDRIGRRRVLTIGILLFGIASVACAAAPTLGVLLPARALQGVGAALLMPSSLAILGDAFGGEARGRAIGTWAAAGAMAAAAGPPLGGWLVESVGWRAIFTINLPLAAGALVIARRFVEESGDGGRAIDWPGAVTATAGLGATTWGLTRWSGEGLDAAAGATLAAGALLLLFFVLVERRRGDRAMMPLALFGNRAFAGLSLLTFLLYGALGGLLVLLPFVLIAGGGYSSFDAGLALLPFALVVGLGSRLAGTLAARVGPRRPLTIGPAIVAAGFVLLIRVEPGVSYAAGVLPAILAIAVGMAIAAAPLTTAVLSTVDGRHTGTASGFNSAVSRTGGLIATALAGVVIGAEGAALTDAFHRAALVGAGAALLAAATGFATLGGVQVDGNQREN